jgi:DNA topoisomerase
VPCPVCGGKVQVKKSKRGRKFYVCENNPNSCEYISWNPPKIGEKWSPEPKEEKKEKTKTKKSRKKTTKRKTK